MRRAFVHEALLVMAADVADTGAPGAAVTQELCGHWEHEPPCPLAPHHSEVRHIGDGVQVRVLFAVEPELEETVRGRIETALSAGHLVGPEGEVAWTMTSISPGEVTPDEHDHAQRLVRE